ncbi:MAG: DNA alkylation repair protein [Bacteroidota bacterium]|nr:DNA alkylation repair protein [Bacteroidota bacterium]
MLPNYISELSEVLYNNADPLIAPAMKAYMKNKFEFLGIKKPDRAILVKPFLEKSARPATIDEVTTVVNTLWNLPEREFSYIALEILSKCHKLFQKESIYFIENLIIKNSWWDTVDGLASNEVGYIIEKYPELKNEIVPRWIQSDNMWLNRTAIIFQLKYKNKVDTGLLEKAIVPHLESKEFFHRKAIGWALRQYAYFNERWVMDFIDKYDSKLSNLSKREALKHF